MPPEDLAWDQDFVEYWREALPGNQRSWHDLERDSSFWSSQFCEIFKLSLIDSTKGRKLKCSLPVSEWLVWPERGPPKSMSPRE